AAMERECSREARGVGIAQRFGEKRPLRFIVRQLLCLPIVAILEAMLDPPQKSVRILERVARALRQRPALGENGQRVPGATHTKVGLLAAANDLKRLGNELDFSNAAGTELDIGRIAAAALLLANLPVNIAEAFVRVVVQILAIDERRDPMH